MEDRTEFVKEQLRSYSGATRPSPLYTFVLCPYHSERTPSFQVRHDPTKPRSVGWGQCRGCGVAHKWNDFAPLLGLKTFGKPSPEGKFEKVPLTHYDDELFGDGSSSSQSTCDIKDYPLTKRNWNKIIGEGKRWRSFSYDRLLQIGAKFSVRSTGSYSTTYVRLPVNVNGVEVGWIHGRLTKHEKYPSYLNMPGIWSKKKGLFLFDQSKELMRKLGLKTVVIVEGPRDALRLYCKGIPAVCMLGTQSWTKAKLRCLESIGAEHVVVCMDGDKAGRDATRLLIKGQRKTSEGYDQVTPPMDEVFTVTNFKLYIRSPEDDPGSMSMALVQELKSLLK
jgi:hypothetical protein